MKITLQHNTTDIINALKANKIIFHQRNNVITECKGILHGNGIIKLAPFLFGPSFELLPEDEIYYDTTKELI